ncbi:hypothetical protein EVAR_24381_1 [Eumeta japonica]|uniref:Uncharacterized protein n=1 Tax=Eumeta variegata TaxID=151549 RepID=A0A4C1YCU6_EUMVA|nr:hypothetical protein EVAR_24381_1 [Eumeta japonica]
MAAPPPLQADLSCSLPVEKFRPLVRVLAEILLLRLPRWGSRPHSALFPEGPSPRLLVYIIMILFLDATSSMLRASRELPAIAVTNAVKIRDRRLSVCSATEMQARSEWKLKKNIVGRFGLGLEHSKPLPSDCARLR